MKFLYVLLFGILVNACSSGKGGSSSDKEVAQQNRECIVLTNQLQLSTGESCNISSELATEYSLSTGKISCDSGILTWGGSEFNSREDGTVFNGLTVFCSGYTSSFACDGKEVCSEMTSCSEQPTIY